MKIEIETTGNEILSGSSFYSTLRFDLIIHSFNLFSFTYRTRGMISSYNISLRFVSSCSYFYNTNTNTYTVYYVL